VERTVTLCLGLSSTVQFRVTYSDLQILFTEVILKVLCTEIKFMFAVGGGDLSYGRQSVDQFVLVWGSPLGPMTKFYFYPFFSDNCFVVLSVGRPL
jgi:hypothetical protein